MRYNPFYKVIVIKIDMFESTIIDERHFGNNADATDYAATMNDAGYITIIAQM